MNKLRLYISRKQILISILLFIIYALLNLMLILKHEPWRDEIHPWLMAKTYSIPELFLESKFDGHPILWHLILMPFAKLNFPIITLSIINYIIVLFSAYLLLFNSRLSIMFKLIVLFTIPFTYTYSAIARNYSLILLFLLLISVFYPKRYEKPILYSILICFLIHTHSLAWGIVAGLTITFHFVEIYKSIKYKNVPNVKKIIIGLILIAVNTIIVVFELYGSTNTDFSIGLNSYVLYVLTLIICIIIAFLLCTIWIKSCWKEYFILAIGLGFNILVYTTFYSSVLYQRFILIFVFTLFYLLLLSSSNISQKRLNIICVLYLTFMCVFALKPFTNAVINDYKYNYSSANEVADYINENLPSVDTILIDNSTMGQAIIPYLDNCSLYDIDYDCYVDSSNVSHDLDRLNQILANASNFSGKYIIISNNFYEFNSDIAKLIYKTPESLTGEHFTLYYIY